MRFFSKLNISDNSITGLPWLPSNHDSGKKSTIAHEEAQPYRRAGWKVSRVGDGDTAMALFDTPDQVNEVVDPKERRRLERKIDFMILPYLAVSVAKSDWRICIDTRQMLRFLLHRQNDS